MSDELTCIKCEKRMRNFSSGCHQPDDGLGFHTRGHYGSTYFDPMDGSYLEVSICDECIKAADEKGIIGHGAPDPRYSWYAPAPSTEDDIDHGLPS